MEGRKSADSSVEDENRTIGKGFLEARILLRASPWNSAIIIEDFAALSCTTLPPALYLKSRITNKASVNCMKNLSKVIIGLALLFSLPVAATTPYTGKVIALDAGHGGTETGAVNTAMGVREKDVNLAVVYALKSKLEPEAMVVLTRVGDETLDSRKSRVDQAIADCKALAGRTCDILVSVHHNGSSDQSHDGTMVIYNEKSDKPLATALHDALLPLTGKDEGYDNGGYGITVYGHLVSALTEAYYITNDWEAQQYLLGTDYVTPSGYTVKTGARVNQEAQAQLDGISKYFATKTTKGGGR